MIVVGFVFGVIESDRFSAESSVAEFEIEELAPAGESVIHLAALGDVRSGVGRQAKIAHLLDRVHQAVSLEGIILLGDNTPLWGSPSRSLRKTFTIPYASLIGRGAQFFAILGNHDLRRGMKEHQLYFPQYNMNGRPYYSKVFGENLVEVFFLNSNGIENDAPQIQWLEQALGQSNARWKVVAMHHPLYTAAKHHPADPVLTALLEPILLEQGVTMVISGHNHIYERLHPVKGITYLTAGSGGKLNKGDLKKNDPMLAGGNDQDNVVLVLEFSANSCRSLAYTADGKPVDEARIVPMLAVSTTQ